MRLWAVLLTLLAAGCVGSPPADDLAPTQAAVDGPEQTEPAAPTQAEEEPPAERAESPDPATPPPDEEPAPKPESPRVARYVFNGTTPVVEMWGSIWAEYHPIEVSPNTTRIRLTLTWNGSGDLDPSLIAPYRGPWYGEFAEYQLAPVAGADWVFTNDAGTPAAPDQGATLEVAAAEIRALDDACAEQYEEAGVCAWNVSAFVKGASAVDYLLTVEVTDVFDVA
jgi:hypothetical protein